MVIITLCKYQHVDCKSVLVFTEEENKALTVVCDF